MDGCMGRRIFQRENNFPFNQKDPYMLIDKNNCMIKGPAAQSFCVLS
jgi:hypothetical protein